MDYPLPDYRKTTVVRQPPETIFSRLCAPEFIGEWYRAGQSAVRYLKIPPEGPVGVGTVFTGEETTGLPMGQDSFISDIEVIDLIPNRRIAVQARSHISRGLYHTRLEPGFQEGYSQGTRMVFDLQPDGAGTKITVTQWAPLPVGFTEWIWHLVWFPFSMLLSPLSWFEGTFRMNRLKDYLRRHHGS